jgi:CRP/FNR family transcriptional regulator, cyclic AMP receptor protein
VAQRDRPNRTARNVERTPLSSVANFNGLQRFRARLLSWPLPRGAVDDLLDRHIVLNFPEKSLIFRKGAPADVVYWVRAGVVDLISPDSKKGNVLVEVAGPGEMIGFMDIGTKSATRRQIFTARARTRSEIGVLTRERINSVLNKLPPHVLVSLAEHINDWWSEKIERWVKFVRLSAHDRLELALADLAEKCGVRDTHGTLIVPQFSHDDFASMIASSRPMVTRLLAELIAQGRLVRRDRRYVLCERPLAKRSNGARTSS